MRLGRRCGTPLESVRDLTCEYARSGSGVKGVGLMGWGLLQALGLRAAAFIDMALIC